MPEPYICPRCEHPWAHHHQNIAVVGQPPLGAVVACWMPSGTDPDGSVVECGCTEPEPAEGLLWPTT